LIADFQIIYVLVLLITGIAVGFAGGLLGVILPAALSGCHGHDCRGVMMWRPGITIGLSGGVGLGVYAALFRQILLGSIVGLVSGLSGIGSGVILVMVMVIAIDFTMHQAVATSSIVIAIISIGGILSYALNGQGVVGLPPHSSGYINLLQWALLSGTSIPILWPKQESDLPTGFLQKN
jgi:hypothetical protein